MALAAAIAGLLCWQLPADADTASASPPVAAKPSWFGKIKSVARSLLGQKSESEIWLAKIHDAAQTLNYTGSFVYQQGSKVQASRIAHFVDASGEYEKLELLDGQPREFIRHDDDVRCYLSESRQILQEKRMKSDLFPALLTAAPTEIDRYYEFKHATIERVAGRICDVVTLVPRDQLRYGYRLWSDRDSGLLLKAQTIDEHGNVIEQVSFTDLAIGGAIDQSRVQPSVASTEGWQVENLKVTPANLTAEGWSIGAPIGGFRRIMEVRRMLERDHEVGQIVYSDGLATISIFVEPAKAGPFPIRDLSHGPINIVSRRQGDRQLTVIGEAPVASIHQIANSVEFKPPK